MEITLPENAADMGLDVIARSELWELIRSLKGTVTIILTTHYMEEAQALADRIAVMKAHYIYHAHQFII